LPPDRFELLLLPPSLRPLPPLRLEPLLLLLDDPLLRPDPLLPRLELLLEEPLRLELLPLEREPPSPRERWAAARCEHSSKTHGIKQTDKTIAPDLDLMKCPCMIRLLRVIERQSERLSTEVARIIHPHEA